MKRLYILLAFSLALSVMFSSAAIAQKETATELATTPWKVLVQQDNVTVEYKFSDCDLERGMNQQLVLLKITNQNTARVTVEWDLELDYNNVCKTCGYDEYHRTYELGPNSVMEGKCTFYDDDKLTIHSKFLVEEYAKEILTNFKVANFKVTK